MCVLVICEILGLFANTFIADGKYSLCNSENLSQPIKMQLSQKQKYFFLNFFAPFLKSTSNFEHFQEKDHPHTSCISEIRTWEIRG